MIIFNTEFTINFVAMLSMLFTVNVATVFYLSFSLILTLNKFISDKFQAKILPLQASLCAINRKYSTFHRSLNINSCVSVFNVKSHLESYPSPLNINFFWNNGFFISIFIIIQIFSGFILSSLYSNSIISSYFSLVHILREVTFGFIYRYIHSNGASFIFALSFIHIARALFFGSIFYLPLSWFSGILIFYLLIIIGFLGYVLPWGQMSFWGATVITNILSFIPFLIEWVCGSYYISEPTLKRFFIFHFSLPFIILALLFIHIFYLHYQSSNNPLGVIHYLIYPFFPYLFSKDFFGLMIISGIFIIQLLYFLPLSHPDNGLTVNGFITPLHILPEWYFLPFYAILKVIPNKNSGLIIMISSFLLYSLFIECTKGTYYLSFNILFSNYYIGISFLFISSFSCILWIGSIMPLDIFITYGRIFLFYYLSFSLILLDVNKSE